MARSYLAFLVALGVGCGPASPQTSGEVSTLRFSMTFKDAGGAQVFCRDGMTITVTRGEFVASLPCPSDWAALSRPSFVIGLGGTRGTPATFALVQATTTLGTLEVPISDADSPSVPLGNLELTVASGAAEGDLVFAIQNRGSTAGTVCTCALADRYVVTVNDVAGKTTWDWALSCEAMISTVLPGEDGFFYAMEVAQLPHGVRDFNVRMEQNVTLKAERRNVSATVPRGMVGLVKVPLSSACP